MGVFVKLLDGKKRAEELFADINNQIKDIKNSFGIVPKLVSIKVGSHSSANIYVNAQKKFAEKVGLCYECVLLDHTIEKKKLLDVINTLNKDRSVNGIIIQYPLPKFFKISEIAETIDPSKDVEGVNPCNIGRLMIDSYVIKPPTVCAVMDLIALTGMKLFGKECVIIGYSKIAGRPLSALLLHEMATVTVCDIGTNRRGLLADHVKRAELVIAAAGVPELIKGEWIKEGAVVIDVGINVTAGGKIVGDVEFEKAKEKASYITPVPGGVGPVTTAMLIMNCLKLFKSQRNVL